MIPNSSIDDKIGRREHPRLRLAIDARLITTGGEYPVRLDNLSQSGAHISRPRVDSFERCVLKWLDYEAWGTMVWARSGYCGVRFEPPLPDGWVLDTRNRTTTFPEGWKSPTPRRLRSI
jgi:hypothetical protein